MQALLLSLEKQVETFLTILLLLEYPAHLHRLSFRQPKFLTNINT